MAQTKYWHTMLRISDPAESLAFFKLLGVEEVRRKEDEAGRYTLYFLAAPGQEGVAEIELTHNWDEKGYSGGRNFGHLCYYVDDIYELCETLMKANVVINRPPRDGFMAFVRTPDEISIELLQRGESLPPREPWVSMPNIGKW